MIKVSEVPKKEEEFEDLKIFCKEILDLLEPLGINPIAHGSLVLFGHIKDKSIEVNDVDFLVHKKDIEKILKVLDDSGIKYKFFEKIGRIELSQKNTKVDIDSIEFWYKDLPLKYNEFDFSGLKLRGLSLETQRQAYEMASKKEVPDKEEYELKYLILDKFMKKKK